MPQGPRGRRTRQDAGRAAREADHGFYLRGVRRAGFDHDRRERHRHPQCQYDHRRQRPELRPERPAPAARARGAQSNQKAYCYLLSPPEEMLSSDARRRLRAIEEFSDLGSGFNIAMQDLDIRGAGNLLGAEQSGFIADIGFETYQKIMNEAVAELRAEGLACGGPERRRAGGRGADALSSTTRTSTSRSRPRCPTPTFRSRPNA